MSKRQSNTLFNYFSSPKGKPTPEKKGKLSVTKDPEYVPKNDESSDSEGEITIAPKKRTRILSDNESDSENEVPNKQTNKKTKLDLSQYKNSPLKVDKTPNKTQSQEKFDSLENKQTKLPENTTVDMHSNWTHNQLDFLKPNKIRDIKKNKLDHPDYDPTTLHVPEDFLNKQTPAMRQWWILKSTHYDSVLFFKVGKFYELYHMDAVVGVQHLSFSYMKGDFAHSGFPETAYAKMAGTLIEKGFKVARVEQTETPDMMNERIKTTGKKSKYDKVVSREICQVSTKATTVLTAQMPESRTSQACYMFAITETILSNGKSRFGVCFVDTTIGIFRLSEFVDDKHCSKLLSLFAENPPGLILTERSKNKTTYTDLLNTTYKDIRKESLVSKTQFYTAQKTLEKLSTSCYFKDKDGNFHWPKVFEKLADNCMPNPDYELVIKSIGACLYYLKNSEIDIQIFSMGKFEFYEALDLRAKNSESLKRDYMVLDHVTIKNLDLLGPKGTLQKTLDYCQTAFGKRLLIQWICRPLCDAPKIEERQKAVSELWNNPAMLKSAQEILKKLPDLERQVAKIHTYGNRFCAQNHPDGRAIFYEAVTYSKRKIQDLLKTLRAFEKVQELPEIFNGCESRLLRKLTHNEPQGHFLDLSETLKFFRNSFDHAEAEKEGKIIPKKGLDADYDDIEEKIADINKDLGDYLSQQSKKFGCKVTYFGSDKKRFQLDIPENKTKHVDEDYQLEGSRKGKSKRYHTEETRQFLADMLKAEAEKAKIILDLNRRIFEKFSQRYDEWDKVIQCLTILDVLCSLAEYARSFSQDICMPKIKDDNNQQIIIENGRHPCVMNVDNFVPNDLQMGVENFAKILILTGPNMGGKSTLMRQAALISVMAQMGSCVPASLCELNLIDRIFTRLGAHDDIIQGQSRSSWNCPKHRQSCNTPHKIPSSCWTSSARGTSTHGRQRHCHRIFKKNNQYQVQNHVCHALPFAG
ncbi:unnamed protein product [Brassicogethes aeneus]|uniref:DNA mismatch repair protein Msh6 n=1 Tax=Brassicogethes aeneus TaxID=1431903 RepID=A0A9P0FJK3_BRAAE|nr:unnamed protein product [Brassicogethes aeneus]